MKSSCDKIISSLNDEWGDAMKRDMDLVRAILLRVEEMGDPGMDIPALFPLIENHSSQEIYYHIQLLQQAGFLNADFPLQITGITWTGHEFIEAAKDNGRWEKAKDTVITKVGSVIFDTLFQVLMQLARKEIGI